MAQESLSFVFPILVMWVHLSLAAAACGLGENAQAARALRKGLANGMASSPTFRRMCLPIAAILAARAGRHGWAAELLGLADAGPPAVIGWMDKWPLLHELRRQLAAELGAVPYQTAWAHGRTLDLDTVTALILEHNAPVAPQAQLSAPPALAPDPANQSPLDRLSPRELDVLRLIAAGYANQEIAAKLCISVTTVKKHVNHIFAKLGVASRAQAIVAAQRRHLS
jgi:DNA-binding CsgD family transcriptional regulator